MVCLKKLKKEKKKEQIFVAGPGIQTRDLLQHSSQTQATSPYMVFDKTSVVYTPERPAQPPGKLQKKAPPPPPPKLTYFPLNPPPSQVALTPILNP